MVGKKHPRAVTMGLAVTTPLSRQQSPQKSLQRTLSDESLCSGRREPSFANPAGLEPGLPSDVLFTSTCAFPSSTLPARRQHQHPHPPGGPGPVPTTASNSFPEKKCEPGNLEAGCGWREQEGMSMWITSRSKAMGHQCQSQVRVGTEVHGSVRGPQWFSTLGVTLRARNCWPSISHLGMGGPQGLRSSETRERALVSLGVSRLEAHY